METTADSTATALRQRGRPRRREIDNSIRAAASELLLEIGYGRLSMEGVAARAGVGKPALYRRWPSKPALVADAVVAALGAGPDAADLPDTGDLGADLHRWLDRFAAVAADPRNAALSLALIAAAAEDSNDGPELYGLLTGPTHASLIARLRTAATLGQLRPDVDVAAIGDALIGSIVLQLLTGRAATAPQHGHALLETLLRGSASTDPEPDASPERARKADR